MPSKGVTDRQKNARIVATAIKTHDAAIAARFTALVEPLLAEGERAPDIAFTLRLLGRVLALKTEDMIEADEANILELGDDAPLREQRDDAARALYVRIVEMRRLLSGLYSRAILDTLNLSGATPQDPVVLERFAAELITILRVVTMPPPLFEGSSVDPIALADDLQAQRQPLKAILDGVAREEREAEATQKTKDIAVADFDLALKHASGLLDSAAQLVNMPEAAPRLRPV